MAMTMCSNIFPNGAPYTYRFIRYMVDKLSYDDKITLDSIDKSISLLRRNTDLDYRTLDSLIAKQTEIYDKYKLQFDKEAERVQMDGE